MTKKILTTIIFAVACIAAAHSQNLGIGTTSPDSSAVLDITSTTKGLLIPRLSTSQRTAIVNPATGLMIYDSTLKQVYFYTGSVWSGANNSTINYVGTSYLGKTSGTGSTGTNEGNVSNRYNIFIGDSAAHGNTTGENNIAFGKNALRNNTGTTDNIAIGQNALLNQINSSGSIIAIGKNALSQGADNSNTIAIGENALLNAETINSTAIGFSSLSSNTSGYQNTATGAYALNVNSTGNDNVANGSSAGEMNTGSNNTFIGSNAGASLGNIGTGNRSGSNNTFIGAFASALYDSLENATAIGANAIVNKSNSIILGSNANVGIGVSSPNARLHLSGNDSLDELILTNSNSGAEISLLTPGTGYTGGIGTTNNWSFPIFTNNTDRLTITSSGNIGISTSTPTSTMQVTGSVAVKFKTPLVAGTTNPDATGMTWRYTSGTGTITLPTASTCTDRIYVIINQTGTTRTISSYRDLTTTPQTTIGSSVALWLQSDGTEWYKIN